MFREAIAKKDPVKLHLRREKRREQAIQKKASALKKNNTTRMSISGFFTNHAERSCKTNPMRSDCHGDTSEQQEDLEPLPLE